MKCASSLTRIYNVILAITVTVTFYSNYALQPFAGHRVTAHSQQMACIMTHSLVETWLVQLQQSFRYAWPAADSCTIYTTKVHLDSRRHWEHNEWM